MINPFKIDIQITFCLDRRISSLQYGDIEMRVQVVVREQVTRSVTNLRNYLDVYSLINNFLDAAVV